MHYEELSLGMISLRGTSTLYLVLIFNYFVEVRWLVGLNETAICCTRAILKAHHWID